MKSALQLYSIRLTAEKDFEKALEVASEQGYDAVEFAGFFGKTADEVAQLLKKYQLEVAGAHISAEEIIDKADETIAFHKAIGNKRIVCPWYELSSKADVFNFVEKLKSVLPKYKENGMKLYYHNHAHEFVKVDNEYLLDIMAEQMPELYFELDLYWVYRGTNDIYAPIKYLEKYHSRIDIFHAKDGTQNASTALGEGRLQYKPIIEMAKKYNMNYAIAECESDGSAEEQIEDTKISGMYLMRNL